MSNYDKLIEELVERATEKRAMPLAELIESENLQTYVPGTMTILYGDELNNAIVPCEDRMILVRDRYDENVKAFVAEYAIYSQHDADGINMSNALNANATYRLEFVGEETFRNMAAAISHAYNLITTLTENDREMEEEFVRNITDDDPLADLTYGDACRILKAARKDYDVPLSLTPDRFLELYNSMKPEEE